MRNRGFYVFASPTWEITAGMQNIDVCQPRPWPLRLTKTVDIATTKSNKKYTHRNIHRNSEIRCQLCLGFHSLDPHWFVRLCPFCISVQSGNRPPTHTTRKHRQNKINTLRSKRLMFKTVQHRRNNINLEIRYIMGLVLSHLAIYVY